MTPDPTGRFPYTDTDETRAELLRLTLHTAIPLWLERRRELPPEVLQAQARECAEVVGAEGDVLQFGGKASGAGRVFNHLADGIACALLAADGGMEFLGVRWYLDDAGRLRTGPVFTGEPGHTYNRGWERRAHATPSHYDHLTEDGRPHDES